MWWNFGEVWSVQLAKSTVLTSMLVSLGSFKVCSDAKESGMQKATGSYRTYRNSGKTETLVPEFAVEDPPWAELQPRFPCLQWRTCPWAEHTDELGDLVTGFSNLKHIRYIICLLWTTIYFYYEMKVMLCFSQTMSQLLFILFYTPLLCKHDVISTFIFLY